MCSIARALEVVGERWSLLIVRDALFAGVTRFGDFQHNLGVATNILRARLDAFVETGIMERRRYSERPEQFEYVLTDKGRDLAPALVALTRGATAGRPPTGRRSSTATTRAATPSPRPSCARRAVPSTPPRCTVAPGPGMPPEYLAQRRPRPTG